MRSFLIFGWDIFIGVKPITKTRLARRMSGGKDENTKKDKINLHLGISITHLNYLFLMAFEIRHPNGMMEIVECWG